MKNIVFLTFLMLLPFASISQKTSQRKFILSVEPNFGVFQTEETSNYFGDYFAGLISGGNIKLSKNFNSTNFGIGLGFYRIVGSEVESFKYYGYAIFKPTVYASLELGNTPKFHRMSFTLNGGFVKGSIENRYKLFVSAGPKINLGAKFKKVNVALYPSVLWQKKEIIDKTTVSYRTGKPISTTRESTYQTFILNLSVIVEFNKFKSKIIPNE